MSSYTPLVSYAPKDALAHLDPNKRILGTQMDAELQAIAAAITSKVDTGGLVLAGNGTAGAPSHSFSSDPNSGVYRVSADEIGFAAGGSLLWGYAFGPPARMYFGGSVQIQADTGVAAAPSYAFQGDTNLGFYRIGADQLGMAVNGVGEDITSTSGSFTVTTTGTTSADTGTARWVKHGNLVVLFIPTINSTSNAVTYTLTGLPANLQPARTINSPVCFFTDNSSVVTGAFQLASGSGTITCTKNGSSSSWTNVNGKGTSASAFSYLMT